MLHDFALAAQEQLDQLLSQVQVSELNKEVYLKTMKLIISGIIQMKFHYPHVSTLLQREVLSGLPYSKDVYENTFKHLGLKITSLLESAQKNNIVRKDINVHVLFLSIVHSVDMYFTVAKCAVSIMDKCFKIPEQTDQYKEQVFTVFIKGTLV